MSELHVVTGGAGYFGTRLVERLHGSGKRVRIFDLHDAEGLPPEVERIRGDIRDADAVRGALRGASVVHHNVALVPLAKDKAAFWSVNRDGTRQLLEAAFAARVRKVVHMSSSAVFGAPDHNPVDDAAVPHPREDYGRAKLAAEEICRDYVLRGLDVTVIRPRTIMGHGRLGIMQILFEWVRQGMNVPVLGDGANRYQFVHADDLADAVIRAADRSGPATYHVGAQEFGTMRETLAGLIRHAGTRSRVVSVPKAPATALMELTSKLGLSPLGAYHSLMYGRSMYFDIERTKRELGWVPGHGTGAMFSESYDWYIAHRDEVLARRGASPHRSPVRQGILGAVGYALSFFP